LSWSFNPVVSLPDSAFIKRMLQKLEFVANVDFFLSETARFADVVLPGSQHEEDEGVVCTTEGRVIKINQAVVPPGDARQDWRILQDIARALGRERGFTFASPREIFDELCRASQGGVVDYSGISYEKIEAQNGVFWPCPATGPGGESIDHPGTPRLFEPGSWNPIARGAGPFYFADGKARFHAVTYAPPTEDVDADYPVILTTGRVVNMFLSGNQTRRIGPLVDQYCEPKLELHPHLARRHGIDDGDWVTVESRRGRLTIRCQVVTTIRPDVVFVPYHWAGEKSINLVTISSQDPVSKIPEYKVCAVRLSKAQEPEYARRLEPQQ
jgi:assimilatory nitrate reductase catalytic subunit